MPVPMPTLKIVPMAVHFIDKMGHDLEICNDARISFATQRHLHESQRVQPAEISLINYLAKHDHFTPFAHQILKLGIKAPIYVARQLRTHQVGLVATEDNLSLVANEESRRYISTLPEFYLPEKWRRKHPKLKQGSYQDQFIEAIANAGPFGITTPHQLVEEFTRMALQVYCELLDSDVAPEQARMVLPVNTMVNWVWTGSLVAWARICNLRLDGHAQQEASEIAQGIHTIMHDNFPFATAALVRHQFPKDPADFYKPSLNEDGAKGSEEIILTVPASTCGGIGADPIAMDVLLEQTSEVGHAAAGIGNAEIDRKVDEILKQSKPE